MEFQNSQWAIIKTLVFDSFSIALGEHPNVPRNIAPKALEFS